MSPQLPPSSHGSASGSVQSVPVQSVSMSGFSGPVYPSQNFTHAPSPVSVVSSRLSDSSVYVGASTISTAHFEGPSAAQFCFVRFLRLASAICAVYDPRWRGVRRRDSVSAVVGSSTASARDPGSRRATSPRRFTAGLDLR